ncbi:glycosyltransferase [Sneathiella chungangensis]|uniref:Glycosyltransferase n=1 Tax=Sneathiella chungangensis TaxID=1418234 RepID=A0A845MDG8_9PROT|nr:glycosyltransferase family 2 protein [Sneathiella chungangensis]MZR21735.1 glycosyltransferase [Sneathiella chungangensis]
MKLSIVATLYKSAPFLDEFYRRCVEAANSLFQDDFEIVLVNDGSPDDSLARAVSLHERDPRVKVLDLSRNFGHHKAMLAGLRYAKGEFIFLIDSDLEEQPEWLANFHGILTEERGIDAVDVVYGVQDKRKGSWFEKASGALFFKVFSYLSEAAIPENLVTARLMRRRYLDALLLHNEREFFIAGLWAVTGFNQKAILVKKLSRGGSNYGLGKKLAFALHHVICFSTVPLKLICFFGLGIASLSAILAIWVILQHIFGGLAEGWPSIVVAICFFGGLNFFGIGVLGLYLGKVFSEVKQRPNAIYRQIYD